MSLQYNYNKNGSERKALVEAVSRILEKPAVYLGAPTFAYAIGGCNVDKNGTLIVPEDTGQDVVNWLLASLQEQGFIAENSSVEDSPAAEATADTAEAATENVVAEALETAASDTDTATLSAPDDSAQDNTLTIEMPKAGFTDISLDNLQKIISSKTALLKKALGTDNLAVIDTGDTLKFPWFTLHGLEGEADAYSRLAAAICGMARKRKRVTAKEHDGGNDKFAFRLFLVQLGFIGEEYKTARRILLRNLTGNSSWKSGHAPERPAPDTEDASPALQPADNPSEEATETAPQPEPEGGDDYGKQESISQPGNRRTGTENVPERLPGGAHLHGC